MFYRNHSLTHTVDIFCNSIMRKIIGFGLEKVSNCLTWFTGLGLTL